MGGKSAGAGPIYLDATRRDGYAQTSETAWVEGNKEKTFNDTIVLALGHNVGLESPVWPAIQTKNTWI
jgi:hypothetical protein